LAGSFLGSWPRVSLPTYQQSLLNGMDRALEVRDPRLASMFAIFTRLTRDDGPPRTERLVHGQSQAITAFRRSVRWAGGSATVPILLVASVMVAIIVLGMITAGASTCPQTQGLHQVVPPRSASCPSSANGIRR
jgi:hypothetical protein